jgi:hypothetical protein
MQRFRIETLLASLILFSSLFVSGQATPSGQVQASPLDPSVKRSSEGTVAPTPEPIPANAPHISKESRLEVIRDFETQLVYARTAFPMGTKGLQLKQGTITPSGVELEQMLNLWGPAVKPGDPAHISFVQIKNDHIHFEINGGPVLRKKWYQRVQISGANGPVTQTEAMPQTNAHGSYVDLYFDKYVPEMTATQLRSLLYPVLDFNARNKEQAYLDTVPPKVKEAIQAHHVLVGMNQEMVLHAKGKPPKKVRERTGETQYEEWIYGESPADVDFVRFVGDEVVRVETMKVDGQKIVRTEKEVILEKPDRDKDQEAKTQPQERPANAPTLKRPGEDSEDGAGKDEGPSRRPVAPLPPELPSPPSGPGDIVATR